MTQDRSAAESSRSNSWKGQRRPHRFVIALLCTPTLVVILALDYLLGWGWKGLLLAVAAAVAVAAILALPAKAGLVGRHIRRRKDVK